MRVNIVSIEVPLPLVGRLYAAEARYNASRSDADARALAEVASEIVEHRYLATRTSTANRKPVSRGVR